MVFELDSHMQILQKQQKILQKIPVKLQLN